MKNINILLSAIILILIGSLALSCSDDGNFESSGSLTLKLSDAPFDYSQFKEANVTIDKIEIRKKDGQYISLMDSPMKSNLLELVNGVTKTLVDMELPEGDYDIIRLYMTSSEMVMNNGNSYYDDMHYEGSSGNNMMQNGMMMNNDTGSIDIPFDSYLTIMDGYHEEYLLDIDVSQSFMLEGVEHTNMGNVMMMNISGFSFIPMMRFVNMATTGTITGTVQSENGFLPNATVSLMHSGEKYTSTHTDENGNYSLIGIPEGSSYSIVVEMDGYMMNTQLNSLVMGNFEMMSGSVISMDFYMNTIN